MTTTEKTSEYIEKKDVMWMLKVLDFSMSRSELIQKIDELSTIKLSRREINEIEHRRIVERGANDEHKNQINNLAEF